MSDIFRQVYESTSSLGEDMRQRWRIYGLSDSNGYYASSAVPLLGGSIETGEMVAPEDGPVAWTAHDDLARAAAITLTKGGLDGITPALTGSEALDLAGVVEIVSEVTDRPIRRVVVSDEEFRSHLLAHGSPEPMVNMSGTLPPAGKASLPPLTRHLLVSLAAHH